MDCCWQVIGHVEIRSRWSNKMWILSSGDRNTAIVRRHHFDSYKQLEKKLHANYTRMPWAILKKILEAKFYKTATVWPHTAHLTNHSSKTIKTCWALLENKDKLISNVLLWTFTDGQALFADEQNYVSFAQHPVSTHSWWMYHQLCVDTGYCLEDSPWSIEGSLMIECLWNLRSQRALLMKF